MAHDLIKGDKDKESQCVLFGAILIDYALFAFYEQEILAGGLKDGL